MDKRYEVYCLAGTHFYDTPDQTGADDFDTARRPVPDGWTSLRHGDWLHLRPSPPPGRESPSQGWKVHVSATLEGADKTAAKVWEYCVPRSIPFKFIPSRRLLHLRSSKYADRGSSGKFVTVYPADEKELQAILGELGDELRGEPGPYILSDLRWGDGPLHVRYGGFAPKYCPGPDGALVPAVEDAGGRLVPDRRGPAFHVPTWVKLPTFLEPHLAARRATTTDGLPYRIERALHFSNGGGVYAATDTRTGDAVVLKEARPHAGLASDGADAVTRLEREKAALERVAGLGVAPQVRDWFTLGEHSFLVMSFLPGRTLNSFFAERHPLLGTRPDIRAVEDYTRWALHIHAAAEEAVEAVHGRGVVFNDLHMFNIMVAPDERTVALLDFEAAAGVEEGRRQSVAHPGFVAPADRTGFDVDRYALACLRIALFVPLTTLLAVDRSKAGHLARIAAEQFPGIPREFLDRAVDEIAPVRGRRRPAPTDAPLTCGAMAAAILASATPERDDRLFPGDIAQFAPGGGLALAHGAAGVLYALAETGAARYEEGEQWLLQRAAEPEHGTPPGLYDGLLGIAYVLDRLGHTGPALDLVERALAEQWQRLGPGMYDGLAGLGLVLDHFAQTTGESILQQHAMHAARLAFGRPALRAGLLHGVTGTALLLVRLYERTGDIALLDLAAEALRRDLRRCVVGRHGAWLVDEGSRTMPYVGAGSVGIAMVLDDYLGHRDDEEFARARAGILPAAQSRFYAQPGLFRGRAGMILHLGRTTTPGVTPRALDDQISGLDWYTMRFGGGTAFPGDQLMRLSMDLATGTAGCLLALGAARRDATTGPGPAGLPFLPPPQGRRSMDETPPER
ncbi:class III lanthionine synthetase LanKC [Streptomyces sp. RB6PN25]|uniref:Class III lanthionine synthetase LanKC n=1 Tax=Streptomyces humicola TaxID=2953240 RepID=A0ABT1Q021_9ACTN|nr:class III lanthionine synthetase LanKC [Streptomyces humicola]MCQ4082130.1 class III lanthionine synthetase LanKC [Streptomyces humicola]